MEHFERMAEARCDRPLPRVIQVQSVHPNPGKTYMPHCTVLHRCGEDTGCCPGGDKKCGPKDKEFVQLYFLVSIFIFLFFLAFFCFFYSDDFYYFSFKLSPDHQGYNGFLSLKRECGFKTKIFS